MAAPGTFTNIFAGSPDAPGSGIYKGSAGSPLPTSASDVPDETYTALGYGGNDGPQIEPSIETNVERAWGGTVVKVTTTEASVEVTLPLFELLSVPVLQAAYGEANVVVTAANSEHGEQTATAFKGELPDPVPYVIRAADKKAKVAVVLPSFQVTNPGSLNFNNSESTKPELTGVAYPDADGVLFYLYTDDGVLATTP